VCLEEAGAKVTEVDGSWLHAGIDVSRHEQRSLYDIG